MPNPALPVHAADPHLIIARGRYWIYATDAGIYSGAGSFGDGKGAGHAGPGFAAWSSEDLVNWKDEGRILTFGGDGVGRINWARRDDWAPAMVERDGRFYFYFCADSSIGVAVGDSPTGPFTDPLGRPLVPHRPDLSAIDPLPFIDDDGRAYLNFGAVPGFWLEGKVPHVAKHLSVRELGSDMTGFVGEEVATIAVDRKADEPWGNIHHIEAPFVFKRQGIYYLMWSQGSCTSGDVADAYRVNYATATSPVGPWQPAADRNPVLQSDPSIGCFAPGHHSVIQIPGSDEWYIAYHANDGKHVATNRPCDRRVWIDRMYFDDSGEIMPIIPTIAGVDPRPLKSIAL